MHKKAVEEEDSFAVETEFGEADIKDLRDYNKIFHPRRERECSTWFQDQVGR